MKIEYEKGNKAKEDRKIQITTKEKEVFSIFKLCQLCNQLAINELILYKPQKKTKALYTQITGDDNYIGTLFFKEAVIEAIQHAEKGIDWADKNSDTAIKNWCVNWKIKYETIEEDLQRMRETKQTQIGEYNDKTN